MGYVLPGWLDEILDFIGINWPNVDEDDYREMADAMREFADKFEGHGGDAHQAVNRILASSEGYAVDSLKGHWGKVKGSHLDKVPEVARTFATACDAVAEIIYGMKVKAEIELGAMAAGIGIAIGAAFITGGLSALIGAAETAAMRELIRRIIKEAQEEIVAQLLAQVTEPVTAKLEKMTEDMVLDLVDDAISLPPGGADGGGGAGGGEGGTGGKGGMNLNSADGGGGSASSGGGGGGGKVRIDPDEFDNGAEKLSRHGSDMQTNSLAPLGRAKGAFGRTKGRDPFTQAFDSVLDGAISGSEKALKRVAKHVSEGVPGGVRGMAKRHRDNERGVVDDLNKIGNGKDTDGSNGKPTSLSNTPSGKESPASPSSKPPNPELSVKGREDGDKTKGGDPIDMATGAVLQTQVDLSLPGVLPLVLDRTHISDYRHGHFYGPSWASPLDERLEREDSRSELWWHKHDGSSKKYGHAPDLVGETVLPHEGRRIPLTRITGTSGWDLAITDPRTGLVRRFLPTDDTVPTGEEQVWWLAQIEDRNGNTITFHRDHDGLPISVVHSGGYHVIVHADEEARLITSLALRDHDAGKQGPDAGDGITTSGRHNPNRDITVVSFGHNEAGDLTEIVNSSGLPLVFGYDDRHRMTSWTDRNGSTFRYVYDPEGRVVSTEGPDGCLSSRLAYSAPDADGVRTTRYTDSLGNTTTYRINRLGQVIAETNPLGHTTRTGWSRWDQVFSRTDPVGNITEFERNDQGDIIAVTYPDGACTEITYDPVLHRPVKVTHPDGTSWTTSLDSHGNVTAVTAPDGAQKHLEYHATGAVAAVTNPLGARTSIEVNGAGMPVRITDPYGSVTAFDLERFGRPERITDPLGRTTRMSWTVEGLLTRRESPTGAVEQWDWDAEGNCLSRTDPLGQEQVFTYGHFDLPITRTTPDGVTFRFSYDTELRLTKVTRPASWAGSTSTTQPDS